MAPRRFYPALGPRVGVEDSKGSGPLNDLNNTIANHLPAWQKAADDHRALAAGIRARGPRKTAGDVSPEVVQANQDAVDGEAGKHDLAASRFDQRVAAGTRGIVLHHGDDEESRSFAVEHQPLLQAAGAAGRLKFVKPGTSYQTSGLDR